MRNVEKLRYLDTCLDTLKISLALVIGVGVVVGRSTRRALMNHLDEMTNLGCRLCSSLRVQHTIMEMIRWPPVLSNVNYVGTDVAH